MIIDNINELIKRLENMFTVQTQEVIMELNKIKEMITLGEQTVITPTQIEEVKPIEVEIPAVETQEEIKEEEPKEIETIEAEVIHTEKTIEELRKEYKDKFNKNPFM